jgi:hypothetical protein
MSQASTHAWDASDCALVILSWDGYRDLWEPCLTLYRRYWPDCPYPMFLVTGSGTVADPRVRTLPVGRGLAWSDGARVAITAVEHTYVLLMLDDFLLSGPVASEVVEARRLELDQRHGAYLRLVPLPRPTARVPGCPEIGEHEPGVPFRASLQAAFWRRSILLTLLAPGESPWEFEENASARSASIGAPFYTTRRAALPYVDALTHGQWLPRGRRLCRREGLPVDPGRPSLPLRRRLARAAGHVRLALNGPMSWRLRRALRSTAARIFGFGVP